MQLEQKLVMFYEANCWVEVFLHRLMAYYGQNFIQNQTIQNIFTELKTY